MYGVECQGRGTCMSKVEQKCTFGIYGINVWCLLGIGHFKWGTQEHFLEELRTEGHFSD